MGQKSIGRLYKSWAYARYTVKDLKELKNMSRCVEVFVRVYPEGAPGKDAKPGDPLIAIDEGMTQKHRFITNEIPKDFCRKMSKFIQGTSNGSVISCRENKRSGGFPVPEEEYESWCKYL